MGDDKMTRRARTYSLPLGSLQNSQEYRLDAGHYSPDLLEALAALERTGLRLERLVDVVEAVILPNRFKRVYVEPSAGVPFLQGSHVVHFRPAGVKHLSPEAHPNMDKIIVRAGWILLTRSGTVGRVTLCPGEWDGWAASEHIIRIVPNEAKCLAGYLCSFLASRFGQVQLNANVHGAVVDELTDEQVSNILVPVPDKKKDIERVGGIDEGMKEAIALKSRAVAASRESLSSATAWLETTDDSSGYQGKDMRISGLNPERLAQSILEGGAKPRPETKRREAS